MEQISEYSIYVSLGIILVIGILYAFYTEVVKGNAKDSKLGFIVWLIKDIFFCLLKPDSTDSPSDEENENAAGGND